MSSTPTWKCKKVSESDHETIFTAYHGQFSNYPAAGVSVEAFKVWPLLACMRGSSCFKQLANSCNISWLPVLHIVGVQSQHRFGMGTWQDATDYTDIMSVWNSWLSLLGFVSILFNVGGSSNYWAPLSFLSEFYNLLESNSHWEKLPGKSAEIENIFWVCGMSNPLGI